MKKTFENVSVLTRLRNQEFPDAINTIYSLLEEEEIEVVYIKECYAVLKAQLPKLNTLRNNKLIHPLTEVIVEEKALRFDYLQVMRSKVNLALRSPIVKEREAAKRLKLWLHGHRLYYTSRSELNQSSMVGFMNNDLAEIETLTEDLTTVGASTHLNAILSLDASIKMKHLQRTKELGEAKLRDDALRSAVYKDVKTLFNAIEMALKLKNGVDAFHMGVIRNINSYLLQFYIVYESRKTRKKNLALAEGEKEKDEENAQGGETPVITMRMSETGMMNGNGGQTMMPTPNKMGNDGAANGGLMNGIANDGGEAMDEGLMRMATLTVQPEKVVSSDKEGIATTNESDKSQKNGTLNR